MICSVDGCVVGAKIKGLCAHHYNKAYRLAHPPVYVKRPPRPILLCEVSGCGDRRAGNGKCSKHYHQDYYLANAERLKDAGKRRYQADPMRSYVYATAWKKANPEIVNKGRAEYRERNREKLKQSSKARYAKKREFMLAQNRARYYETIEQQKIRGKKWRSANGEKIVLKQARRRALQFKAMPEWANEFFIAEAYHLAKLRTKATGVVWHVDHIVPLNSKKVCGLHVEHNLQVILGRENHSKCNRYWPDMP